MKESQQIEWKSSWRDDYLRWICGFANAEGGKLVIGRDDRGVAVGVKDAERLIIESWGRGIEKINRECREHGIEPPLYDFGMAGLMLTFRANPAHLQAAALEQSRGTTPITTQETAQETAQEKMLALLRAQPSITRRELARRLDLSDSGIKYHLEKMKAAGVIRHVGPTKSGYWEVLK